MAGEDIAAGRPIFPASHAPLDWAVSEETWPVHNFSKTSTASLEECNATYFLDLA